MTQKEAALLSAIAGNGGAIYAREVKDPAALRLLLQRGYVAHIGALNLAAVSPMQAGQP